MRRKLFQTLLVIGISSLMVVFPAYRRCSTLAWVNRFPTDFNFENSDSGDSFVNQRDGESRTFIPSAFWAIFPIGMNHSKQVLCFSSRLSFLDQKPSILRC